MRSKTLGLALAATLAGAAPALAAETLTIGFTVSQTGKLNNDSTSQMRGFELWRDNVNAAGGIKAGGKQYQIKFVTYDDESQNARVQQLYTRLITQDKAQFLFSPYSSGLTATSAIISEQYGKVMITTGAAEEKTYQLGNKNLFQLYSPASQYLAGAVKALKELNPNTKIAYVVEDDPFSKAVLAATRKQAEEAGLKVALDERYSGDTTDFGPLINKVVSSGATALLGGGHYADGATLARQLHDQKAGLKWVTLLVAPDSPNFATLGDAAVGVSVPSQWEPQVSFKPDFGPTAPEFTKQFTDKYKIAPGYHAAGGYAAGLVLQHAIEQAGSVEPAKVADALNKIDVTTMFGHTKFSTDPKQHGLQLGHEMVLAQWQKKDGKLVKEVIWPKAAKTAEILY
ncbi:MAG TPA: amino acid ABC transporter substrate-binding protein [Xanthobacteraceae bacterium]|jgi:branched-chain amino acid transport system substrate-binding protein|nr:amino acid ABC transporter substrate-binding protein [Xanthobacteraceae bacterium]